MKLLCLFVLFPVLLTAAVDVDVNPSGWFVKPSGETFSVIVTSRTTGYVLTGVDWLLNGTPFENLGLTGVEGTFEADFGVLHFTDVSPKLNDTAISVRLHFASRAVMVLTDAAHLLVQGLLSGVVGLTSTMLADSNVITLTWKAPSTLDIPDENPDIRGYIVEVVINSISTEYWTTGPGFNYTIPPGVISSQIYFIVSPVNVVGTGQSTGIQCCDTVISPETTFNTVGSEVTGEVTKATASVQSVCTTGEAPTNWLPTIIGAVGTPCIIGMVVVMMGVVVRVYCVRSRKRKSEQHLISPGSLSQTSGRHCRTAGFSERQAAMKLNYEKSASPSPSDKATITSCEDTVHVIEGTAGDTNLKHFPVLNNANDEDTAVKDPSHVRDPNYDDTQNSDSKNSDSKDSDSKDSDRKDSDRKDSDRKDSVRKAPDDMQMDVYTLNNEVAGKSEDFNGSTSASGASNMKYPLPIAKQDQISNPMHLANLGSKTEVSPNLVTKTPTMPKFTNANEMPIRYNLRGESGPSIGIEIEDENQPPPFPNRCGKEVGPGEYGLY